MRRNIYNIYNQVEDVQPVCWRGRSLELCPLLDSLQAIVSLAGFSLPDQAHLGGKGQLHIYNILNSYIRMLRVMEHCVYSVFMSVIPNYAT